MDSAGKVTHVYTSHPFSLSKVTAIYESQGHGRGTSLILNISSWPVVKVVYIFVLIHHLSYPKELWQGQLDQPYKIKLEN